MARLLKVDGKAMTSTFFKQLPEVALMSPAMKAHVDQQDSWWGYVRKDADIWLVVELMPGRLFRCLMNPPLGALDPKKKIYDATIRAVLKDTEQLFL